MIETVSVVIPTFNRKDYLRLTLASLAAQNYDSRQLEAIIVCDGCTDGTAEMVTALEVPHSLQVIDQPNRGRSAARNTGLARASGDLILLVDDDRLMPPTFVSSHVRAHNRQLGLTVVSGYRRQVLSSPPTDDFERFLLAHFKSEHSAPDLEPCLTVADIKEDFQRVEILSYGCDVMLDTLIYLYGQEQMGCAVPWRSFITANVSFPREMLTAVASFNEQFRGWGMEDLEFGYRLHKNGAQFFLSLDAVNYHQSHPRNRKAELADSAINYQHFASIHPDVPILQHWRTIYEAMSIAHFNDIVIQFDRLKVEPSYAVLAEDYHRTLLDYTITHGFAPEKRSQQRGLLDASQEAFRKGDFDQAATSAATFAKTFAPRADEQQAMLSEMPCVRRFVKGSYLNMVGLSLLLQGRSLARLGRWISAIAVYETLENQYPFAQNFEPGQGILNLAEVARLEREQCESQSIRL